MLPRRLAACALALAVLPAVPPVSAATKKPACRHLIVDPRGDVLPIASGAHDIVHADIALGRTELAAALTRAASGPTGPAEVTSTWELTMTANGVRHAFTAQRTAGDSKWQTMVTANGEMLPHTFVPVGTSLVWRVKRSALKTLNRPKTTLSEASASTAVLVRTDSADMKGPRGLDGSCLKAK